MAKFHSRKLNKLLNAAIEGAKITAKCLNNEFTKEEIEMLAIYYRTELEGLSELIK